MTTTQPAGHKPPLKAQIHELLVLIEDFGALLERETKALMAADFKIVDALQADKKVMARRYGDLAAAVAARKEEAHALDGKMRAALVVKRTAFTKTLGRNLRALDAAKSSAGRLIDRIRELAQKAVIDENKTHYSSKGKTGSWKSATLSLTVDQSL
jgi:hypothetical protein